MIGTRIAAAVLVFASNWALADCTEPEPGLDNQGAKQHHAQRINCDFSSPDWDPSCMWGGAQEPGPVATDQPKTYTQPRKRGPNLGGQDPNTRAKDREHAGWCEVWPNDPGC